MNKIIIATDLHNTLVLSDDAWTRAFSVVSGMDEQYIYDQLKTKRSRKCLAKELNVSYEAVYCQYQKALKPNISVVRTIESLASCKIPIVIISSASRKRVENDAAKISQFFNVNKIYSKEDFCKSNREDWQRLLEEYNCDRILYFGNDREEDLIQHEQVLSVLVV